MNSQLLQSRAHKLFFCLIVISALKVVEQLLYFGVISFQHIHRVRRFRKGFGCKSTHRFGHSLKAFGNNVSGRTGAPNITAFSRLRISFHSVPPLWLTRFSTLTKPRASLLSRNFRFPSSISGCARGATHTPFSSPTSTDHSTVLLRIAFRNFSP